MSWRYLGFGSPLVDVLGSVDDRFLRRWVPGAKGGREKADAAFIDAMISQLDTPPVFAAGGSAGNTVFVLGELGCDTAMLGKLGRDAAGDFYRSALRRAGVSDRELIVTDDAATGRCLSLVTPDAERTMRADLGVSRLIDLADIARVDFSRYDVVYVEGYMLFTGVLDEVLHRARAAGCRIGFDLASFEIVREYRDRIVDVLRDYVDIVFGNAEEAAALFDDAGTSVSHVRRLAGWCEVAGVKLGRDGALLARRGEIAEIPVCLVEHPVDTTAAGDYWAAGVLFGLANGDGLAAAGWRGSKLAGEVVKVVGTKLSEAVWRRLRRDFKRTNDR